MHRRLSDLGVVVGLAAVYVVAARFGLAFDAVAGFATLVWPPTGISIAALLLLGYRAWPGIFIGALAANLITGASLPVALGIGVGNTLEGVAGALLMRQTPGFLLTLENVKSSVAMMLTALSSTLLSASIGVASLYFGGVIAAPELRMTWRAWWIGDMVGAIVVTPMILVWARPPRLPIHAQRWEMGALVVALAVICKLVFFGDHVALYLVRAGEDRSSAVVEPGPLPRAVAGIARRASPQRGGRTEDVHRKAVESLAHLAPVELRDASLGPGLSAVLELRERPPVLQLEEADLDIGLRESPAQPRVVERARAE